VSNGLVEFFLFAKSIQLLVASAITFPCQGVFNFIIFIRPRYISIRNARPDLSRLGVIGEAIWNPSQCHKDSTAASATTSSNVCRWYEYLNVRRWFGGEKNAHNNNNGVSSCVIQFSHAQSNVSENRPTPPSATNLSHTDSYKENVSAPDKSFLHEMPEQSIDSVGSVVNDDEMSSKQNT
jgi:hypothetical protein